MDFQKAEPILLKEGMASISQTDIESLEMGCWITDNVITF